MYRGIKNLRGVTDTVNTTQEQLEEIRKCASSFSHFLFAYVKTPYNYPTQPRSIPPTAKNRAEAEAMARNSTGTRPNCLPLKDCPKDKLVLSNWHRYSYYENIVYAFFLWKAMFSPVPNSNVVFTFNRGERLMAYQTIRFMIAELPAWLQTPIIRFNHDGIKFSTYSTICFFSARRTLGFCPANIFAPDLGFATCKQANDFIASILPVAASRASNSTVFIPVKGRTGNPCPQLWDTYSGFRSALDNSVRCTEYTIYQDPAFDSVKIDKYRLAWGEDKFEAMFGKTTIYPNPGKRRHSRTGHK